MSNAKRDQNYVPTLTGVSYVDLTTPELLAVDPANNRLLVSAIVTGNDTGATSSTSTVSGSATSVTLKASNTSRVRLTVVNDSTATLYVKEGVTATTSDYTWRLSSYDTLVIDDYTGVVDGIWDSATGNARVTEVV